MSALDVQYSDSRDGEQRKHAVQVFSLERAEDLRSDSGVEWPSKQKESRLSDYDVAFLDEDADFDVATKAPNRDVEAAPEWYDSADEATDEDDVIDNALPVRDDEAPAASVKKRKLSHVCIEPSEYPRSAFSLPADGCVSEQTAILQLIKLASDETVPDYTLTLDNFDIYTPATSAHHATELTTLDKLQNATGSALLLFDGCLSSGNETWSVRGVPFQTLSIEGYLLSELGSSGSGIYIQSPKAKCANVWYQLGNPSREYRRFFEPFSWLVQLSKLVINYLAIHKTEKITLSHFRSHFCDWLQEQHSADITFQSWHAQCRHLRDFGTSLNAHVGFIWKECHSIDDRTLGLCRHPFWGEIDPLRLNAIRRQPEIEQHTIVTPFVFDCFKRLYFGDMLEKRPVLNNELLTTINKRKSQLGLTSFDEVHTRSAVPIKPPESPYFERGSIVAIEPDEDDPCWTSSNRKAPSETASDETARDEPVWYAYVQDQWEDHGVGMLDVLWLYEPSQTTLQNAEYPFTNELFLSDSCNCRHQAIEVSRVKGTVDVTFYTGNRKAMPHKPGFFVRRRYRTVQDHDTYDFSSLEETDFKCRHRRSKPLSVWDQCIQDYKAGDSVLVRCTGGLEPAQITAFDVQHRRVIVQRFVFRQTTGKGALPNETGVSSERVSKAASHVVRRCNISSFSTQEIIDGVPAPYSWGGTGDFYYINRDQSDLDLLAWPVASGRTPWSLEQSLNGLGMFCGGGNFDRGLEGGGPIKFKWAVDWDEAAIHTYRANTQDPGEVRYFWGSVNDYLARALSGRHGDVAKPGQILFVGAGSPCPGYSSMQQDKLSAQSRRNASMVASVLAYVDFYSPRYLVLENVVALAKTQNVFPQILATLVAMGYQVQQFNMGAWSYGSPQLRRRVFIVASLPGTELLDSPPYSHDNYAEWRPVSLGSSNGLKFGIERNDWTTFRTVTAAEATSDLPDIGDAQVQICPAFPDHRTPARESGHARSIIPSIPVRPRGMGIARAARAGRLPGALRAFAQSLTKEQLQSHSKSYSRVNPDSLFPTVLTRSPIRCSRTGRILHWSQHRVLTVMEKRRAQGFPDHEVIIGLPPQQHKIVGNSVDRKVAIALGLAIRSSWEKTVERVGADKFAAELAEQGVAAAVGADDELDIDSDSETIWDRSDDSSVTDADDFVDLADLEPADLAALEHRIRTRSAWVDAGDRSVSTVRDADNTTPSGDTTADAPRMRSDDEYSLTNEMCVRQMQERPDEAFKIYSEVYGGLKHELRLGSPGSGSDGGLSF